MARRRWLRTVKCWTVESPSFQGHNHPLLERPLLESPVIGTDMKHGDVEFQTERSGFERHLNIVLDGSQISSGVLQPIEPNLPPFIPTSLLRLSRANCGNAEVWTPRETHTENMITVTNVWSLRLKPLPSATEAHSQSNIFSRPQRNISHTCRIHQ